MTSDVAEIAQSGQQDRLWRLYEAAREEKNFQVLLNWDRTKFFFLFNAALFSVAGGLSHFAVVNRTGRRS
jgi:hypothetical protein